MSSAEQIWVEAAPQSELIPSLLARLSIEATPKQVINHLELVQQLPPRSVVYIPWLPGRAFSASVTACRHLAAAGLTPIPHLAARSIDSLATLDRALGEFVAAGVEALLLIAGDLARPLGPFKSTLDILESGLLLRHGLRRVGIAGHPDGHPAVSNAELQRALQIKLDYARATDTEMWLVTQFIFGTEGLIAWERQLRHAEVALPIRVGLPGPAKLPTLISYALQCGVAVSARQLTRRPSAVKLLGRWYPDALVEEIAAHKAAEPESLIAGLHLFMFGDWQSASGWLAARRGAAQ